MTPLTRRIAPFLIAFASGILACGAAAGPGELPRLHADATRTSVSGLSSGE